MKIIGLTTLLFYFFMSAVNASFNDVSSNHVYNTGISYIQNNNIVSGYSDGSYRPDNLITRAEFTKVIVNSKYDSTDIENCIALNDFDTEVFPDVQYSHNLSKFICMAKVNNTVDGFSDGNFKPDEYITLGEASKILAESFNLIGSRIELRAYAEELIDRKYIPSQLRALNEYITRGQMAEMIYRIKANNRSREALKETALYDRIVTIEYYGHDAGRDKLTFQIIDSLNYSVFRNNFGEMLTMNIDEKSSREFFNDLKDLNVDENDGVKAVIYINDDIIKYGFIYELNGEPVD